jgi:hypothetical protein
MKSLKSAALAMAAAVSLVACGGGSSGSPTPTVRPSSPAVLKILEPRNGQVIHGSAVHVRFSLRKAKIVKPTTTHIVPIRGHVHLLLDGKIYSMNYGFTQPVIRGVNAGNHVLQLQFVASDHLPFDPPVVSAVTFEVKR